MPDPRALGLVVKSVAGVGDLGEIVKVRPGFARNYLLPQGLAAPVSPDALKQVAAERKRAAANARKELDGAKAAQELLRSTSLHVEAKAGEGGHLYGSVTGAMIAEGLRKQGIAVEDSAVQLENPIKELGIYQVAVRLHAEVTGLAKVYVVPPPPEKGEADSKRK